MTNSILHFTDQWINKHSLPSFAKNDKPYEYKLWRCITKLISRCNKLSYDLYDSFEYQILLSLRDLDCKKFRISLNNQSYLESFSTWNKKYNYNHFSFRILFSGASWSTGQIHPRGLQEKSKLHEFLLIASEII